MLIPIDQIDPASHQLRQTQASAEDDAALLGSIQAVGVLQPILVRPVNNRFEIVAGLRRWRAAKAAGLTEIPVTIAENAEDAWATAAQAAENLVRTQMAPVDLWRAIARLKATGNTLQAASQTIGISHRRALQLEKLGELHPDIIAAIESQGMPSTHALHVIASAPLKAQATALKNPHTRMNWGEHKGQIAWDSLASVLRDDRAKIPRGYAIFDHAGSRIRWDEDLFAEPGSPGQFTTRDVDRFFELQQAALAARIADPPQGEKWAAGEWHSGQHTVQTPAGCDKVWDRPLDQLKRGDVVFAVVTPRNAQAAGKIAAIVVRATPKPKKPAKSTQAGDATEEDDTGADTPPPPAPEPKIGITTAGLAMIAEAKTAALQQRLRSLPTMTRQNKQELLVMLVISLTAQTVTVQVNAGLDYEQRNFRDLLPDLVTETGELYLDCVEKTAPEALARFLRVPKPGGPYVSVDAAAEWIGRAIGADHVLPRFDTEAFLATCGSTVLRPLAEQLGIKLKSVAELRQRLVGQAPDWRPAPAQFGAAGPVPPKGRDESDADGDEEPDE